MRNRPLVILTIGVVILASAPASAAGSAIKAAHPVTPPAAKDVPRIRLLDLDGRSSPASPRALEFARGERSASTVGRQVRPGDWLFFDPEPVTWSLRLRGTIHLRNFTVVGDYPRIELEFGSRTRAYERVEIRSVDGVQLSVFDVVFPAADLGTGTPPPIRFDCFDPVCKGSVGYLRLRPSTIPKTQVVRINEQIQYSSHVVNIVAPYNTVLASGSLAPGDRVFPYNDVARLFFRYFRDEYEELSLTPSRVHSSPSGGAVNDRIYSEVDGIGIGRVDRRGNWGGSQVLLNANASTRGDPFWNYLSLHETGHYWGFYLRLFEVAGLSPSRSSECDTTFHVPILAEEPSFMGQCLWSPLRIERQSKTNKKAKWVLSNAPAPLIYHPLQLYAMGLLPPEEVPPVYLRRRQDRPPSLTPGKRVPGSFVEVTIDDVIARHGERYGPPMPSVWRRAHIVVSPDRLLSQRDMDWYNFYAKRISDPDLTGILTLEGVPSMEFATLGQVDLRSEIYPLTHPMVRGAFEVSYPKLGKKDLRGITLRKKLPTRFEAGKTRIVSGRVKSPGKHSSLRILLGTKAFVGELGANGSFAIPVEPGPELLGPQWMTFGLGDHGKALARIAPVYVE